MMDSFDNLHSALAGACAANCETELSAFVELAEAQQENARLAQSDHAAKIKVGRFVMDNLGSGRSQVRAAWSWYGHWDTTTGAPL